ncbi:MAG TPA: universal stress protein [Gemmatimonadales bacterium]
MFPLIMVPLDGSPFADRAVDPGAALAAHHQARLLLVAVHERLAGTEAADREDREALAAHLLHHADAAASRWHVRTDTRVVDVNGDVADTLSAFADQEGVGLVVMTTHGRGAAGRAWFGSVADRFIRSTAKPVLLLRHEMADGRTSFRRILVPLDGSAAGELAIDDALAMDHSESEIIVLRVVVPVIAYSTMPAGGVVLAGGVLEDQRADAERYARGVAARIEARGHRAHAMVVVDTSAAAAILDAEEDRKPDLIVMSGTIRGGVDRLLLGSVMDKVVRHAQVPVLMRRTPGPGKDAAGR